MKTKCSTCGGDTDRPGKYRCVEPVHPKATLSQRIAMVIENDVNDRRGMKISNLDEDIQREIRDKWAELIFKELNK